MKVPPQQRRRRPPRETPPVGPSRVPDMPGVPHAPPEPRSTPTPDDKRRAPGEPADHLRLR